MQDVYTERFGRSVCVGRYEEFDTLLIDPFHVRRVETKWRFHNRPAEVYGVENLNQISGDDHNLEKVLMICESYLLRPPVDVLGWPIPLYQQPAWDLNAVSLAIKGATRVSEARIFDLIIKKRDAANRLIEAGCNCSADVLAQYYYYPVCQNGRDPRSQAREFPMLYLRYDLGEAFVVQQ